MTIVAFGMHRFVNHKASKLLAIGIIPTITTLVKQSLSFCEERHKENQETKMKSNFRGRWYYKEFSWPRALYCASYLKEGKEKCGLINAVNILINY